MFRQRFVEKIKTHFELKNVYSRIVPFMRQSG